MSLFHTKRIIWDFQKDHEKIFLAFILGFPGQIGYKIRNIWWKRHTLKCGDHCIFEKNARIQNPENCLLGKNIHLKYDCYLNASGSLVIGDNVTIGERAKVWTDNHLFSKPEEPFMLQGFEYKQVVIGDETKIGACSFIKPGVLIGKRCRIMAGSVLSKCIPDDCVVGGNPAVIFERK